MTDRHEDMERTEHVLDQLWEFADDEERANYKAMIEDVMAYLQYYEQKMDHNEAEYQRYHDNE